MPIFNDQRNRLHPRRNHRVDSNQAEIVKALRDVGAYVYSIGQPFDLIVLWRDTWHLLEVKEPKGTLTAAQKRTLEDIKSHGWNPECVHVVRNVAEALGAIGG